MRVVACSRKEDVLRWATCSLVCPLMAEDEPDGDNGGRMSCVESKSESDAPGSVTGVDDREASIISSGGVNP